MTAAVIAITRTGGPTPVDRLRLARTDEDFKTALSDIFDSQRMSIDDIRRSTITISATIEAIKESLQEMKKDDSDVDDRVARVESMYQSHGTMIASMVKLLDKIEDRMDAAEVALVRIEENRLAGRVAALEAAQTQTTGWVHQAKGMWQFIAFMSLLLWALFQDRIKAALNLR
jgi:chromosome segregation ATPase